MNNSNITLNEEDLDRIWKCVWHYYSNHSTKRNEEYFDKLRESLDRFDRQQILENQEKAKYLDYIIQDKILSKDLVHFMNFATDSEMFDKLFKDEEFTTHWYAMLRRLEKLQ